MTGIPSRRAVLGYALAAPAAGLLAGCAAGPRHERLDIAAGESGGMYFEFATLLSQALVRYRLAEHSSALQTEASAQNLHLLAERRASLSLALADTVAHYRAGANAGNPLALGRVYQNYFHCIVRADAPIRELSDLAGRRLGTGAAGSGTWVTGQRILEQAGLKSTGTSPREAKLGYVAGIAALESGRIDALFLFGGMPVGSVSELAARVELRLLDLSAVLPGLRSRYPGLYDRVVIPAGTYPGVAQAQSLGVANLLMAPASLPEKTAGQVVRLLVERAQELIPHSSAGIQYLTPQTLVSTAGQPLHPGARQAYRQLHG
ncbi:TAXI family TRAP transporter solute-binding subunit [Glutamicibacter protophormiae]|uniref:TAXI family TRAP transporter solute-binding subunit n=1 Tax=Glutamicibacter protophormiae TaxID=37930 RepID=UPI00331C76B0